MQTKTILSNSKLNLQVFLFILGLFITNKIYSQTFTKATTGIIVNEKNNSYFATWGDYDKDGDLDLFHSLFAPAANNPTGNNFLFQNNCNSAFTKTAKIPGGVVTDGLTGSYSYWIDYDNDNDLDLYVGVDNLYKNNGDGSFTKIDNALTAPVTGLFEDSPPSFADYDNDGYLDAYTGKHAIYNSDHNGDYTKLTIAPFNTSRISATAAVSWADYDNDGFMDMYVVNIGTFDLSGNFLGFGTNYLYHNNGNGTFSEITSTPSMIQSFWSYGCAWADIDNDLDLDLMVEDINSVSGRRVYLNNNDGTFTKVTTGVLATVYASGQAGFSFGDYDNDGDLDLFTPTFGQNKLFDNNGDGTFTNNVSEIVSTDLVSTSFGASWADYDNDGDLDLFVPTGSDDDNDLFYVNNTVGKNWLKLHLSGFTSNKDAIGARVYVKATINGVPKWQMREVNANTTRGGESGGSSGHVVHFGINDATVIDSLKIVWPASGIIQNFVNVTPNRFIEIAENLNVITENTPCKSDLPISNPNYISGKTYIDVNNNCVYDDGTDSPLANQIVSAKGGVYYAFSDDNGNYTLNVPDGSYIVETLKVKDFELSTCQVTSYNKSVSGNQTVLNNDFSFQERRNSCGGTINLTITGVAIEQGNCPSGQLQQTPCANTNYSYCVTINNTSNGPTPVNAPLNISLPTTFSITLVTNGCNNAATIGNQSNNMTVLIANPIPVNGSCTVCFEVAVGSPTSPPFIITAQFNNAAVFPNLVVNGDFSAAIPGFTSQYNSDCVVANPGNYCVGTNPNGINSAWNQNARSATQFLFADGASNLNVWEETVAVIPNTYYNFSGWFNNIVLVGNNFGDPQLELRVNNALVSTTPVLSESPDAWIPSSNNWCSGNSLSATLTIRAINVESAGHDFGIDDISFRRVNGFTQTLIQNNSCSCDPNDKVVSPKGCGQNGNIGKEELLTFKVRFENMGTGPAHNILLSDKLDSDLDLSTLQILSSSHTITSMQIIPDNNLIIKFDGIELPSNVLHPDSGRGFVIFSILPKTGLPDGTVIKNQTGIYFDQNEVVLTDVTTNTLYDQPTPDASFTQQHNCSQTGLVYDFTYTGSTPDNATYLWTFEDGMPATSMLQNPSGILFSNNNSYKLVTLTVERNGCTSTSVDTLLPISGLTNNGNKVTLCHNGHLISVNTNALGNHLSHGDCIGDCPVYSNKRKMANYQPSKSKGEIVDMEVYPNPSNTECKLQLQGLIKEGQLTFIELYNFSGQMINVYETKENELSINTTELANGIYLLKTLNEATVIIKKLIIRH